MDTGVQKGTSAPQISVILIKNESNLFVLNGNLSLQERNEH
jgi:hypothetical protein